MYLTTGFEGKRHGVQPQNGIPGFSLHCPKEFSYGYLRFEGNEKNPLGCRWLFQFSFADLFPYLPKEIFPFPSDLRFLENAKKNLIFHFGV